MKAHEHFIKYVLRQGHSISVDNGGDEMEVECCKDYDEILGHVGAADDARLSIFTEEGNYCGQAYVIIELDDDETMVDWIVTPFMEEWDRVYEAQK